MNARRSIVLACLTFALTACGGGGGGGSTNNPPTSNPPPATPTAEDSAKAQNAQVRMSLVYPALTGTEPAPVSPPIYITWRDLFDNELGYKVERRRAGSSVWEVLETLAATNDSNVSWQGTIANTSDGGTYRVSATFRDFSLPLYAAAGESEINVEVPASTPQILTAADSNGGLRVSVSNAGSARTVDYFVGFYPFGEAQVANATSGGDFATTVPAQRLVSEAGMSMSAYVRKSAGLTMIVSTLLNARSSDPALLLRVAPSTTTNLLTLTARATSWRGIDSVQFFANGQPLRRLDSPNRFGNWVYALDPAALASSTNTFRAVATDSSGATTDMEVEYTLDTVPALSVEGVFDGMIATGGRLNIQGTFGDNVPGTVLTIQFGNKNTVLRTGTSPFNLDYSLAGLSGERILSIRAESPSGKVNIRAHTVVVPSTSRTYELISTDTPELLATGGGIVLYKKSSGAVIRRNAAGVETQLQLPAGLNFSNWWLAAGKILAQERVNGHVHVFTGPGQTQDLTPHWNLNIARPQPSFRGEWVTFASDAFDFSAHNLITNVTIAFATGASQLWLQSDIDTTPGHERVLFPAIIGGTRGIYAYELNTGVTDLMLSGAYEEVRTDGTRLVARADRRIDVAPLSNPTATSTLVNEGSLYFLKDGLIGFSGVNAQNSLIAVALDDGSTTRELATYGTFDSNALQDGTVIFGDSNTVHSWTASAGENLILDTWVPTLHTQSVAYLLVGSSPGALYRTTLP